RIVSEQLDRLEITLDDDDRQLLIDLFDKMRDLDIDFGKVKDQLEDITSTIKDKLDDLDLNLDEGFWEKRSEEHTSELQSRFDLVCRLLLEKKKEKCTRTFLHRKT